MPAEVDEKSAHPAQPEFAGIAIDRAGEVPVGVQLAWALRTRVGEGRLAAGQRLPGLREMAETSGLNVNTVRAVYQRLEQEGLIDSQQGSGTFVAAAPGRPSPASSIAASAARAAAENGVDPREVAAALYVSPDSPTRLPADRSAERRRALRAQIAALERTLGEMEAEHPGFAPALQALGSGPALLGAAELERVRTQLVRRLSLLQARIDENGRQDPSTPARQPAPAKPGGAQETPKRAPRKGAGTRPAVAGA